MVRSKIAKTLGALAAALALTALVQSPASAAPVPKNWTTSYPTWGNAKCSSPITLTDSRHVIIACMEYGNGYVQPYALVLNSNADARYVPATLLSSFSDAKCPVTSMPGNSTRVCQGNIEQAPAGCNDVGGLMNYFWYEDHWVWLPVVRVCR